MKNQIATIFFLLLCVNLTGQSNATNKIQYLTGTDTLMLRQTIDATTLKSIRQDLEHYSRSQHNGLNLMMGGVFLGGASYAIVQYRENNQGRVVNQKSEAIFKYALPCASLITITAGLNCMINANRHIDNIILQLYPGTIVVIF